MTTPDERIQGLRERALAANVELVTDPGDLARQAVRAHLVAIAGTGPVAPDRPEIDVRLHGPGVPDHEVAVRESASFLLSIQEAVSSIGQALRHEPTLQGAIQAQVLAATELRMTPTVGAGSLVFHLVAAGETITGGEAPELTGTDTLVDAAMGALFSLIEQSAVQGPEGGTLAHDLRRLGPRTAKHLSDLSSRVIDDEIEVDLTWRNPAGQRRMASLQRQAAMALERAITINKEDTQILDLVGAAGTPTTGPASTVTSAGSGTPPTTGPGVVPGVKGLIELEDLNRG